MVAPEIRSYPVAIGIIECLELNDIGVPDDAHNLKFSILNRQQVPLVVAIMVETQGVQ